MSSDRIDLQSVHPLIGVDEPTLLNYLVAVENKEYCHLAIRNFVGFPVGNRDDFGFPFDVPQSYNLESMRHQLTDPIERHSKRLTAFEQI